MTTNKFELLNNATDIVSVESGKDYVNALFETNKRTNKDRKGKAKTIATELAEKVNEKTLNNILFLQTNTTDIISLVSVVENVDYLNTEYKAYKIEVLKNAFKVDDLKEVDENDLYIVSKHLDTMKSYAFNKATREKTNVLKEVAIELNNAKQSKGKYNVLGNSITPSEFDKLMLAMYDSKDKNIENLYSLIKDKCLLDKNYPSNKIIVNFEKAFKNIPTMNTEEVDIMTYQQARETLAKIDINELEKITKKKAHSTEDIKKAIKKNILSVDVETLEVLETYKIKF